ncbi:MAG: hypothetical protein H0U09_12990 [Geodermatophilaceae bacterium]|nr:hypothetical protein [Geodermatophilaceae bacterium]
MATVVVSPPDGRADREVDQPLPTWRVHLRDGTHLDVNADWLTEHYAGLTFETVYVIVNSPRWVVVRRVPRGDVERIEEVS